PANRARHLPPQRLRHVGADELLLPEKIVARRDLPVRTGGFDGPMGEVLGVDDKVADGCLQRPDLQKTPPPAREQVVKTLPALRIVAFNVNDGAPTDQSIPIQSVPVSNNDRTPGVNASRDAPVSGACGAAPCRSRCAAGRRQPRSGAAACSSAAF